MSVVEYRKNDRIAYIAMNRPDALNALNDELNDELWRVWEDFNRDDAVDVAIITGNGRAFCAGADLKSWIPRWETANMLDVRKNAARGIGGGITRGQHRIYKPVIAAVNGHAIGGGFEIALACDIRVASTKAVFGSFEVRIGLHQGDGGLVRLVNIAGMATALEVALTGRPIPAEEAYRMGLVNAVVEPEELMEKAEGYARMILGNSQQAVRSAKETVLELVGRQLDDALLLETINAYSSVGDFSEVRERIKDFSGKSRQS